MGSFVFNIKSKIAENNYPISVNYLVDNYLHGIPLTDQDGINMIFYSIKEKIKMASEQVGNFINRKFVETTIEEEKQDYIREDWIQWGYLKTHYRINELISLTGVLGTSETISFDNSWLTFRGRSIEIVPGYNATGLIISRGGAIFLTQLQVNGRVPNFWRISYKTGFTELIPLDIISVICKLATINVLSILGDILLGAGIASISLSMDGLSETKTTTQSAENSAYSARIRQYLSQLKSEIKYIENRYRGIEMEVL